jgi:hypothetical protein
VERRVVWRCHYRRRFWRVEATLKFLGIGAFWTIGAIGALSASVSVSVPLYVRETHPEGVMLC